jgi:hypothetical protein
MKNKNKTSRKLPVTVWSNDNYQLDFVNRLYVITDKATDETFGPYTVANKAVQKCILLVAQRQIADQTREQTFTNINERDSFIAAYTNARNRNRNRRIRNTCKMGNEK